jgi:ethanolamine ammonia-lyase large subunit
MNEDDVIKLNVPLFLRLVELAREDIKDDVPLHLMTEILTRISQDRVATTDDYKNIKNYTMKDSKEDELDSIKRLGGIA